MSELKVPGHIRRAVVVFLSLYLLIPATMFSLVYLMSVDADFARLFRALDSIARILP